MNAHDVIDSYLGEVMRLLPRRERDGIGAELRGLLQEMLAGRAEAAGRAADDAMVLAMLRDFGTPAAVAARYAPAAGAPIIPAAQTRGFATIALVGVALQWALTLPAVFAEGAPAGAIGGWWLSAGLGAFWWPGFMVTMAMLAAALRHAGLVKPRWSPRSVDPDRVNRRALGVGLVWFALGVALMVALPWLVGSLPGVLPQVLAFDPEFLAQRAWPVLVLWAGSFASLALVFARGRRDTLTNRLELAFSLGFIALMAWWIAAGPIFVAKATDDGAKAALGLVIAIVLVALAVQAWQRRPALRPPQVAG